MKDIKRTARIAKVIHHRTPMNIKIGGLVVAAVIVPCLLSITLRVVELGSRVEMYF